MNFLVLATKIKSESGKEPMQETQETWVWSLDQEDPLEKETATHSSILALRIPWRDEPGRLQSTGSQRVGHNWATSISLSRLLLHGWDVFVVVQLCPTLCNPMDCSMPASLFFTISWSVLRLMSIELMMPSNHLILCCPLFLLPSISPALRSFSMSRLVTSADQSIGASASATVLPLNIQGWFPLGLTCLSSLLSKGLSRIFSSTTIRTLATSNWIPIIDDWIHSNQYKEV